MHSSLSAEILHSAVDGMEALPPPASWTVLSDTASSVVFDLGDGSAAKFVRRRGGLSSGEARFRREVFALRLLGTIKIPDLQLPRLISSAVYQPSGFSGPAISGWLHLEKLPGQRYSFDQFSMLHADQRERMGERLGVAISTFQRATLALMDEAAKLGEPLLRGLQLAEQSLASPQDHPKLQALTELWSSEKPETVFLHGNLIFENLLWTKDTLALTGWSETGAGAAEIDLSHFEPFGAMRDALFRGYTADAGHRPDMLRYRQAVAASALSEVALQGGKGHPREAMRRQRMLEEYLYQAGIE